MLTKTQPANNSYSKVYGVTADYEAAERRDLWPSAGPGIKISPTRQRACVSASVGSCQTNLTHALSEKPSK